MDHGRSTSLYPHTVHGRGTRRLAHSVNKWHLSPSIALHFAFYALYSPPPGLCLGLCFAPSARLVPYVYPRVETRVHNIPRRYSAFLSLSSALSSLFLSSPLITSPLPILRFFCFVRRAEILCRANCWITRRYILFTCYLIPYSLTELFWRGLSPGITCFRFSARS